MVMDQTSNTLSGQYALVTGGSRGIGAAICKRLAADGAAVAVGFTHNEAAAKAVVAEITKAGGAAEAVHADLSRPEGPRNLVSAYDSAFGKKHAGQIDLLVNNAGVGGGANLKDDSAKYAEAFDRVFAVNVRSPAVLVSLLSPRMTERKSGTIVNVGSCLGESVPIAGALYPATKFALAGLTRGWSRELGPLGIRVNGVQPGPVDTDMNPADGDGADQQRARTSLGRYGKPEEIAAAVAWLASPQSSFVSGEMLTVDGGTNA